MLNRRYILLLVVMALILAGAVIFLLLPKARQPEKPALIQPTASPLPMPSLSVGDIVIDEYSFSPAEYKIRKGMKITWLNRGKISHTVTAQNFGGQHIVAPGQSWTLDTTSLLFPGEFNYRCDFHPQMQGKIIVLPEKDESGFSAFFYSLPEEQRTCISEALQNRLDGFLDGTITIPTQEEQQSIMRCTQGSSNSGN